MNLMKLLKDHKYISVLVEEVLVMKRGLKILWGGLE